MYNFNYANIQRTVNILPEQQKTEKKEKKIETSKQNLKKYSDFLICPLCGSDFVLYGSANSSSLKCRNNNHTYDISKKGYVNLFNGQTKIVKTYDKNLFAARKIVSDAGLYGKLTETLCEIINNINYTDNANPRAFLDAGCGCGNLTADIFNIIKTGKNTGESVLFAVDLSKDGIDFAASDFCEKNLLWIVANLNNLPLSENKFDVILNIMSPANYLEFQRVLKPGGVLLKVVPDSDYLKELRRFIYKENDKNEYSNKDVLANLEENMTVTDITGVKYNCAVRKSALPALFDMTPLTLNIKDRERVKDELTGSNDGLELTLAFKIAVCKSRK